MDGINLTQNPDAQVWANEFCKRYPGVPNDEALGWFANAIMCGYDHHRYQSKEYKRSIRRALVPWWRRVFTPLNQFGR